MGISDKPEFSSNSIIEFRTNQWRALKGLFDPLKDHIADISFLFSQHGIKVMQISGSGTFLVTINLDGDNFEHFYCSEKEQYVELCLSLVNIHKIFKAINNEDNMISWYYTEDDENSKEIVTIEISSEKKRGVRVYDFRLQESDDDTKGYNEITGIEDYAYSLTMPCADLQHICRDLKNLDTKWVDITHDGNSLAFETKTNVCANCRIVRYPSDDGDDKKNMKFFDVPEGNIAPFKQRFKFDLLNSFSKCAQTGSSGGGTNVVRIHLDQNKPLVLKFSIGSLGELTIAIAPYEDSEEE